MRRKHYIVILLFLWWPINNIHRLWNNSPAKQVEWYWFTTAWEDIQWYIHDLCQTVSYAIIFWAICLYVKSSLKRDSDIVLIISGIAVIQSIDVIHYLGWHRRSEVVLTIEGLVLAFIALKIFIKHRKTIRHYG